MTRSNPSQAGFKAAFKSKFAIIFIAVQAINTPVAAILTSVSGLFFSHAAAAQTVRSFPETALRGKIAFKSPPQIELDGKADRLSPGARIRDEQGMLAMTGALEGKAFVVNFKREAGSGMVHEVWLLTAEEAKVKLAGEKK
jgi:hypothetical protein